jgi:serine/threonine-protein kinase
MDMSFDDPAGGAPAKARGGGAPRIAAGVTLNDRYQVDDFAGPSAYGEVYRGRDLSDGRLVIIKAINPGLLADARVRTKLEKEIQIAVQLDHKNVGATYGLFGAMVGSDAVAYLAAEYVDGQTLREMIEKKRAAGRTFSLKGTYNVIAHLCNALVYAHGATVHGGLTPDSVLVNSAGRVKVVDFGLARTLRPLDHFQAQVGSGGLAALPPEMATAPDTADARADLYSVGVILFELLTGRPPSESFERPSAVVPGVPPAVDEVVATCLQPLPNNRYPDAQAVKEALHAALGADLEGAAGNQARPLAAPPAGKPQPPAAAAPPKMPPGKPAAAAPPPPKAPPGRTPQNDPPSMPPISSSPRPPSGPGAKPPAGPPKPAAQAPVIDKSFNVDSALSSVDEQTERWLIQKDKLDFGPFNMRDVRSQVEAGKILGDHTIIDTENGERRKVKDHPQLRQLVMETETKLAEKQRVEMEDADKRKHRGKVTLLLAGMFLALAAAGGGVFFYFKKTSEAEVARKQKEADLLDAQAKSEAAAADFLKGVEISLKVDPPAPKTTHRVRRPGARPGSKDEFSDVTNLGDASEGGGDETLDQSVVQGVMKNNFKILVGCILEERRRNPGLRNVDMDFIIKGTGSVSAVKVNGQTGSPLASCMYGKMQTVSFPKFNGAKTHASFSLSMK